MSWHDWTNRTNEWFQNAAEKFSSFVTDSSDEAVKKNEVNVHSLADRAKEAFEDAGNKTLVFFNTNATGNGTVTNIGNIGDVSSSWFADVGTFFEENSSYFILAAVILGIVLLVICGIFTGWLVPVCVCCVHCIGFGARGVVRGSLAACCHSRIGNVAAGSCFACCQSFGAVH